MKKIPVKNMLRIRPSALRKMNRMKLKISKHSPEILLIGGIVTGAATVVLACKETLKVPAVIEEHNKVMDQIHEAEENNLVERKQLQKETFIAYRNTVVEIGKIYAPALGTATISLTCILASNKIMRDRHAVLLSAYTALSEKFRDYRGRVRERFGDEVEEEINKGVSTVEVTELKPGKKGKNEAATETKKIVNGRPLSIYARAYDDGCKDWRKDPEYNLMTLRARESYCNNLLRIQGHLFLSDVYDMLGFPQSKASRQVGWIYDPSNPNLDNYVDFGIYNIESEACRDFVNGYESVIWLDFNVNGPIIDILPD